MAKSATRLIVIVERASRETRGHRVAGDFVHHHPGRQTTVSETDSQPATEPVPATEPEAEWLTLSAASRLMGCYVGATKSLALAGMIKHRTIGLRVQYCAASCRRWAERRSDLGVVYHRGDCLAVAARTRGFPGAPDEGRVRGISMEE
jgi:hypothetical protein